jgi:hypothetical protein
MNPEELKLECVKIAASLSRDGGPQEAINWARQLYEWICEKGRRATSNESEAA